jgi:galactokinase
LSESDQEAVRQQAIAAMNITQQAKKVELPMQGNTALIDGVRKFLNVRDLDMDMIDRINPFEAAYAVLAKSMNEKLLLQVQESIAAKRINIPEDEARELAKRAVLFKQERNRLPDINSSDPWEQRMAQGVAAFTRYRKAAKAAQQP